MLLEEYLANYNLSVYEFSKICGLSHTSIYNIILNKPITKRTAKKIEKKTKGMVIYNYIYKSKGACLASEDKSCNRC